MFARVTLAALAVAATAVRAAQAPGFKPGSVFLSPSQQLNLCLGTLDTPANNTPLFLIPCNTTLTFWGAWEITHGDQASVRLSGTQFCLDAGVNPHDNGPSKLFTCTPVPQQRWFYTTDLHIAITGGNQCLDAAGGGCGLGGCAPGTFHCGGSNTQTWYSSPVTSVGAGVQLHIGGSGRCLTPSTRGPSNGTTLFENGCIPLGQNFENLQLWDISAGEGQVRLHGTNLCLDAGTNPANGVVAKVWQCFPGLFQQTWNFASNGHISIVGGNQCLDLRKEDNSTVQTWQCSNTDPQQVWTISAPS